MTPLRLLAVSALAAALASCGNHGGDSAYDTSNPYGAPQGGGGQAAAAGAPAQASNPTYDTPAAYEETTGTAATPAPDSSVVDPGITAPRSTASPSHASAPKPSGSKPAAAAGGTSHVVVKGDTLGGIARKYGVSAKAIMTANGMTKDVVVLGKTLQIPAH